MKKIEIEDVLIFLAIVVAIFGGVAVVIFR